MVHNTNIRGDNVKLNAYKKVIMQAATVAVCTAVLICIALIPSVIHYQSSVLKISVIYGVIALLSCLMLPTYSSLIKTRDRVFVLLLLGIAVTNSGYFLLSVSKTLSVALIANRISYFGSAFLPAIMIVMIADLCGMNYSKKLLSVLFTVSFFMFLLAASGGVFDFYYRDVSIEIVDGVSYLVKEYGPLHSLYSVYIFACFGLMLSLIVYSFIRRKISTYRQAVVISAMVFSNIAVWFVEQLVTVEFEFLSVSYLATEIFLILFYILIQDFDDKSEYSLVNEMSSSELPPDMEDLLREFLENTRKLTAAERKIIKYYGEGCDVQTVADQCYISIHTVRKHNANIYQKLKVGSREELVLYMELFRRCGRYDELFSQDSDS